MANLVLEGFDWFPSGQSVSTRAVLWSANQFFNGGLYAGGTSPAQADVVIGRFGFGKAIRFLGSGISLQRGWYVMPLVTPIKTGFVGLACYRAASSGNGNYGSIIFFDAVNTCAQCQIRLGAYGVISLYRGPTNMSDNSTVDSGATFIAASAINSFQEDEWFHLEIKGTIDGTDGAIEVRVNTKTVLSVVAGNTNGSINTDTFDSVCLGFTQANGSTPDIRMDDVFVNDTTGSENNDWSGNLRVKGQFMIANGAVNQFTIGGSAPAATNWQSVLNNLLDDTKYVYDTTVGDQDLYTPDPNLNSPIVRAVQVRLALRQDDSTQRSAKALLRLGTSIYLGSTEFFTNQTYTFYKERWQLNPSTGVSFTGAEVNASQVGLELIS